MTEPERKRYLIEPEHKKSACEEQIWKNTLKNDWNISADKVLSKTKEIYNYCGEDVQIFHYSPLFGYHLKNQGYESSNLAADQKLNYNLINKNSTCVLFIKTFKGTLNKSKYNLILDIFDSSNLNLLEKYTLNTQHPTFGQHFLFLV